ncbi:hypothetical protein [Methylomagnum sp.]
MGRQFFSFKMSRTGEQNVGAVGKSPARRRPLRPPLQAARRPRRALLEYGGIWLLELEKFTAERIENDEQRWLQLFKQGDQLDKAELPDWMNTPR